MSDYVDTCIFCKIAACEFETEFASESDRVVAFNDINPVAPVHVLVVPKAHIESAGHIGPEHDGLWEEMLDVAQDVAGKTGVDETGYRLVTNVGAGAGQEVFHLHVHIIGGRKLKGIG